MNTLPDPKDVTTKQAAEILLAHGWKVYPHALPYGEFFYIPTLSGQGWNFQVACLAYREFYKEQRLTKRAPDLFKAGENSQPSYTQLELGLPAVGG